MKVIVLRVAKLNNGAHFLYMAEIVARAKSTSGIAKTLHISLAALEKALQNEDAALKLSRKNLMNDTIKAAVARRARIYAALKKRIDSFSVESDALEAVTRLQQALKDHRIQASGQRDKEGGLILHLLDELQSKYAQAVDKLSLGTLLSELEKANGEVIDLMEHRTEEEKNRIVGALKTARAATDAAYRDFVDQLNAHALLESNAAYADFIAYMNAEIVHYQREVLHRGGKSSLREVEARNG
ncbi:MAG: DUF6261 family protein [Prevotellaceae bacterium]|jgi:hypothetical protein|nr:DUF6261 family protein [Prevotellaceae bacterium]